MKKKLLLLFILFILVDIIAFLIWWFGVRESSADIQIERKQLLKDVKGDLLISPTYDENEYINLLTGNKLNIQVYTLTYDKIIDAIIKLRGNLADVKIMLENKKYKEFGGDFDKLANKLYKYGIELKSDEALGTNYLHSKLILTKDFFIIQSGNLTYSTFYKNREHFFVSKDEIIYKQLNDFFEKDWNGEKIQKKYIHPNLLICNINCREKIEELLKNAKKSIYIQNQYITDENIINILNEKHNLDNKIILSSNQEKENLKNAKFNKFIKILNKPYNHTKIILIDKKYLLVSSINLSTNSMDNNREHGIIIIDQKTINKFLNTFYKDRENSDLLF